MNNAGRYRTRTAILIGIRGARATLFGIGPYLVVTVGAMAAAILTAFYAGAVHENDFIVIADPLQLPLNVAVVIMAVYLALTAVISISREHDSGTIELLFYGPVDAVSFIAGKALEQLILSVVMMTIMVSVLILMALLANYSISFRILLALVIAIASISSITSFGLLLSSLTRKVRTSILVLIALLLLFLGIQLGESVIASLDAVVLSPLVAQGISLLAWAAGIVNWLSPFAYLDRGMRAMAAGDAIAYLLALVTSLIYTVLLLTGASFGLQKKGVTAR